MDLKEYQEICKKTAKKFESKKEEAYTWGLGLAGEAGDVAGCIKKVFAHENKPVIEGIKENIGDTLWYMAMLCNVFEWNLDEILKENIAKLEKRYPKGFTLKDAQRDGTKIDWNEK
jgi:NTP pyrophosphatase (non-canonical NTP hydrolase)